MPTNQQPDHFDQDRSTSQATPRRLGLALALGAVLLLGAVVILHLTGELDPSKLH